MALSCWQALGGQPWGEALSVADDMSGLGSDTTVSSSVWPFAEGLVWMRRAEALRGVRIAMF